MDELEIKGATPQSCDPSGGEVVLTRTESDYLSLLLAALIDDPFSTPDPKQVHAAQLLAGVSDKQAKFISSWIKHKGDLIALSEIDLVEPDMFVRYLASPAVFRLLAEASKRCPNLPPPIPTKEELAAAWGVISRTPSMPLNFQKEARQELSKLMGYYSSGDGINVGVQVIVKGDLTDD